MLTLPENLQATVGAGRHKVAFARNWQAYLIAAMLGGAFIGLADLFMLAGAGSLRVAEIPGYPLIEGLAFGIGLVLVVFAGGELATSAMMILPVSVWEKGIKLGPMARVMVLIILGNLLGSIVVASLIWGSGIVAEGTISGQALESLVNAKAHKGTMELFFRGILCNIFVCLATWASTRTTSDVAKILITGWCVAAFIASGTEHSIANMTTFSLGLFHGIEAATWGEAARNLSMVLMGNIVGGALFVGAASMCAARGDFSAEH